MLSYNKIVIKIVTGGKMGKKFSEYTSQKSEQVNFFDSDATKNVSEERKESLEQKYDQYSKMGNDQLMSEFLRMSRQRMAEGSLDAQEMQRIQETLFPYLSEEQKKKFQELMGLISR